MQQRAYLLTGDREQKREEALAAGTEILGSVRQSNLNESIPHKTHPDLVLREYGLFSVDDARLLAQLASLAPVEGTARVLIVSLSRIFHEAQNALLKLFEEPPVGVTLILIVPSSGILLPTLLSRLQTLPQHARANALPARTVDEFLAFSSSGREKYIDKLIERTKSDKEDEKQFAREDAVRLMSGLTEAAYTKLPEASDAAKKQLYAFLEDAATFQRILHERSAPLKMIFAHVLLTLPL